MRQLVGPGEVGQARDVLHAEHDVDTRETQVGVDEDHVAPALRVRHGQVRGDDGLAFVGGRARDDDGLMALIQRGELEVGAQRAKGLGDRRPRIEQGRQSVELLALLAAGHAQDPGDDGQAGHPLDVLGGPDPIVGRLPDERGGDHHDETEQRTDQQRGDRAGRGRTRGQVTGVDDGQLVERDVRGWPPATPRRRTAGSAAESGACRSHPVARSTARRSR